MQVIFLDVDGVIDSHGKQRNHLEATKVSRLVEVRDATCIDATLAAWDECDALYTRVPSCPLLGSSAAPSGYLYPSGLLLPHDP